MGVVKSAGTWNLAGTISSPGGGGGGATLKKSKSILGNFGWVLTFLDLKF